MINKQSEDSHAEESASSAPLRDRIAKAKQHHSPKEYKKPDTKAHSIASRMIIDLFAGCVFGAGIGYWLDGVFSTKPTFFVILGIIGILAGFLNMYRTHQRYEDDD